MYQIGAKWNVLDLSKLNKQTYTTVEIKSEIKYSILNWYHRADIPTINNQQNSKYTTAEKCNDINSPFTEDRSQQSGPKNPIIYCSSLPESLSLSN